MASADICSSATTPRVYASTTQSICASLSTLPVPLGPDDVDRRESTHRSDPLPVVHDCRSSAGQRTGISSAARPRRPRRCAPSASTTTTRGVRASPQATASAGSGQVGPSSSTPGLARRPRAPADRSQYAVQTCRAAGEVGVHEDGAAAAPGGQPVRHHRHRVLAGHRRRGRPTSNACGSSSAIVSGPRRRLDQAVRPAVLPEQLPAPPARHQRLAGGVHAGERDQPAAAGGVQRGDQPALGAERHAVRRRSPRCSRRRSGRRRPAPPRRPGTSSTARTRAASPRRRRRAAPPSRSRSIPHSAASPRTRQPGAAGRRSASALDVRLAVGGRVPGPGRPARPPPGSSPGTAAWPGTGSGSGCRSRSGRCRAGRRSRRTARRSSAPDRGPPAEDQRGQRDEALAADHVLGERSSSASVKDAPPMPAITPAEQHVAVAQAAAP